MQQCISSITRGRKKAHQEYPHKSEPPKRGRKNGATRKLSKSVSTLFDDFLPCAKIVEKRQQTFWHFLTIFDVFWRGPFPPAPFAIRWIKNRRGPQQKDFGAPILYVGGASCPLLPRKRDPTYEESGLRNLSAGVADCVNSSPPLISRKFRGFGGIWAISEKFGKFRENSGEFSGIRWGFVWRLVWIQWEFLGDFGATPDFQQN